jgi:hypothetical protein
MMLVACLVSPAITVLVRKFVPGQPAYIEVAAVGVVLAGWRWAFGQDRSLPGWAADPMVLWMLFQILYAMLSVFEDWRVGALAVVTRVVPMAMAFIAFTAIREWDDLERVSSWVCSLALLLLPVGIIVAFFGNEVLPFWLQPLEKMPIGGRLRGGIPPVSAIFNTYGALATAMLAVFFLALANVALAEIRQKNTARWWLTAAAAFLLVYLSTRRGAFIGGLVGIIGFTLDRRKFSKWQALILLSIIVLIILVDAYGLVSSSSYDVRSEAALDWDFSKRINEIFAKFFRLWIDLAPLGNYLGFAGSEARNIGSVGYSRVYSVVEVGGAQLVAEVGILGAVFLPVTVAILIVGLYRRARRLSCQRAVNTLLLGQVVLFVLYYFKELQIVANVSLAQFFFWSIPGICAALIQYEQERSGLCLSQVVE